MLGAAPAAAQSAVTLVSNTNHVSGSGSTHFTAQSFTTGTQGATVTAIKIHLGSSTAGGISVKIREDNAGVPGDLVATFTNPASLTANALNTFTAPANTVLAAGTTYWVSVHEGISSNRRILRSASSNDQSGESGWTIADGRKWRSQESSSWNDSNAPIVFAIEGTLTTSGTPSTPSVPDTTPPRLTRATVSGDALRLAFSEGLDGSSVPAAAAFDVSVDGTSGAPAAVRVSGRTVTLTLAEAVEPGAAVTVGYDPSRAGGNPLRDAAGNEVVAFSGRPVSHGAPEEVKRIFKRTLAAVASRTVAGALDNIGARLGEAAPASA